MPAEADWSELPRDLLNLISQRVDTEIDLIRFRSVCSSWRSSSIPNHFHISPFNVPILDFPFDIQSINNNTIPISFCYLSKHNFYLIKPPQQQNLINRPWLIRVTQNSCGKTKISQSQFLSTDCTSTTYSFDLPFDVLDFNELSVQLAAGDCFLFTDYELIYGICAFKRGIYALVDENGRTVTVGLEDDPKVQLAAEPLVYSGDLQFLVESEGELLLVDMDSDYFVIDVFRLDEREKRWVEFKNLGDRVLFLGLKYSFSASASDLCVPKGNCVIFIENVFDFMNMEYRMSIVHLEDEDGHPSPLIDHPEYYNLFWPPPDWIVKSQIR